LVSHYKNGIQLPKQIAVLWWALFSIKRSVKHSLQSFLPKLNFLFALGWWHEKAVNLCALPYVLVYWIWLKAWRIKSDLNSGVLNLTREELQEHSTVNTSFCLKLNPSKTKQTWFYINSKPVLPISTGNALW
jgi:hypothetical protein